MIDNVQEAISSTLVGHSVDGRTIVEVVFGLLLGLLVFGVTVLLCRKGTIR